MGNFAKVSPVVHPNESMQRVVGEARRKFRAFLDNDYHALSMLIEPSEQNARLYTVLEQVFAEEKQKQSREEYSRFLDTIVYPCQIELQEVYAEKNLRNAGHERRESIKRIQKNHLQQNRAKEQKVVTAEREKILAVLGCLTELETRLDEEGRVAVRECVQAIAAATDTAYAGERYLTLQEKISLKDRFAVVGSQAFAKIQQARVSPTVIEFFISVLSQLIDNITKSLNFILDAIQEEQSPQGRRNVDNAPPAGSSGVATLQCSNLADANLPYYFKRQAIRVQEQLNNAVAFCPVPVEANDFGLS